MLDLLLLDNSSFKYPTEILKKGPKLLVLDLFYFIK